MLRILNLRCYEDVGLGTVNTECASVLGGFSVTWHNAKQTDDDEPLVALCSLT